MIKTVLSFISPLYEAKREWLFQNDIGDLKKSAFLFIMLMEEKVSVFNSVISFCYFTVRDGPDS